MFTDAAHSSFTWSWRQRYPTGHTQYFEFDARSRMEALHAAAGRLEDFGEAIAGPPEIDSDVEELLARVFDRPPTVVSAKAGTQRSTTNCWTPLSAIPGEGEDKLSQALDRIAECGDPDQLRTIWRRLRGIALLHPRCEDGHRLVRGAGTLEILFVAAIERMRAFIADASILGGRRRPEHLRDMRSLAEAAEDRLWEQDTRRYVRRLIVQQNLFAIVQSRSAGRIVARDLLRYAGIREGALPAIDCNIWREHSTSAESAERTSGAYRTLAASNLEERSPSGGHPGDGELSEAVELHRTAWEMVRRLRLAGAHAEDLRLATSRLERRRSLLRRQLRALAAECGSDGADELRFCSSPGERRISMTVG